jgi:predicted amidophosphoribosyltransferase
VATNRTTFSIEFGVLGYWSLSRSLRNTKGTLLADARPVAAQRDDHQFVFHCFKLCRCAISALPKCKLLPDRVGEKEKRPRLEMTTEEQQRYASRLLKDLMYRPRRIDGETCQTCTEPVYRGQTACAVCASRASLWGGQLADVVVALTYAVETGTPQIRRDLSWYKDGPTKREREQAYATLTFLLWQALDRHLACLEWTLGGEVDGYIIVPSGSVEGRRGGHPIEQFAHYFPRGWTEVRARRLYDSTSREVVPDSVELDGRVRGKRILVFDDTWTTGGASQTVAVAAKQAGAVAAKQAGATQVAILVLGRWLNDSWTPTHRFFEEHPKTKRSAIGCPVTGNQCPL